MCGGFIAVCGTVVVSRRKKGEKRAKTGGKTNRRKSAPALVADSAVCGLECAIQTAELLRRSEDSNTRNFCGPWGPVSNS